jgi:hypothetical protein
VGGTIGLEERDPEMRINASSVEEYLNALPPDRKAALSAVRSVILKNLDSKHFEEGMQYGMIGYYVPHSVYPAGYHCNPKEPLPYICLGSQKNHMALYLTAVYAGEPTSNWFRSTWLATGKKLDMGKGCVRFKKIEDVPLEVVGALVKRQGYKQVIAAYDAAKAQAAIDRESRRAAAASTSKKAKATPAKKAAPAKKATRKK